MASKRSLSILVLFVVLAGLFAAGLFRLFALRFDSGEIYPAYSTYRADPKGAKIFYQSLRELLGVDVERQLRPLRHTEGEGFTVFYLGGSSRFLSEELAEELEPFLLSGGRAVLAFRAASPGREQGKKLDGWGIKFNWFDRKAWKARDAQVLAIPEPGVSGAALPWGSALFFDSLDGEWNVLYRHLGEPVVVERLWGRGSVVLLADSYLFSNEAMVRDRDVRLLAYLAGDAGRLLFDEAHLGVVSQEGVAMLLKRYRLQGVLLALFLLAGLFVWRNSSSFIPKYTESDDDAVGSGSGVDSQQGFTNLLVRHIPQKKLMEAMAEEWKATFRRQAAMQGKMEKIDAELRRAKEAKPRVQIVELYNRLTKILNERK